MPYSELIQTLFNGVQLFYFFIWLLALFRGHYMSLSLLISYFDSVNAVLAGLHIHKLNWIRCLCDMASISRMLLPLLRMDSRKILEKAEKANFCYPPPPTPPTPSLPPLTLQWKGLSWAYAICILILHLVGQTSLMLKTLNLHGLAN